MTKKVISAKTAEALEQVRELIEDDDEERQPNLTLTDACIELVDSYNGDTADDELKSLLHDLEVGAETAIEPEQGAGWLINAANAVIGYFDRGEEERKQPENRPTTGR